MVANNRDVVSSKRSDVQPSLPLFAPTHDDEFSFKTKTSNKEALTSAQGTILGRGARARQAHPSDAALRGFLYRPPSVSGRLPLAIPTPYTHFHRSNRLTWNSLRFLSRNQHSPRTVGLVPPARRPPTLLPPPIHILLCKERKHLQSGVSTEYPFLLEVLPKKQHERNEQ